MSETGMYEHAGNKCPGMAGEIIGYQPQVVGKSIAGDLRVLAEWIYPIAGNKHDYEKNDISNDYCHDRVQAEI
jgi:hypothetical protein